MGKELLAPGHEKIWFTKRGEGAEVVYKVLLEGTQWRLEVWEPFISSVLWMHICSAFLGVVGLVLRFELQHGFWESTERICLQNVERLWNVAGHNMKEGAWYERTTDGLCKRHQSKVCGVRTGKWAEKKGNCVLRASAVMMSWVVAPWMVWDIQNEGIQSPDSCDQSRNKGRDSRAGMEPLGQ